METVEITTGVFELFNPAMGLNESSSSAFASWLISQAHAHQTHLCNHHVAIKRPLPIRLTGSLHVRPDLGHHGSPDGHVGNEMAIHDVDV